MLKMTVLYMANNIKGLLLIYALSLLCTGALFSFLENISLFNGLYWSVTTALSIGYGDLLPTKPLSKILFMIMSNVWLLLIIPSIVANIILTSIKDVDQFTDSEQEEIKVNLNYLTARYKIDNKIPYNNLTPKEKEALIGGQEEHGRFD